jgi:16S rRNA (uracil1498-N3)-methyltransferase
VHARFHAPHAAAVGDLISLPAEEVEHLTRVLRLTVGVQIRVFDGRGHEFMAVVDGINRGGVSVRIGEPVQPAPEPRVAMTLVQAVLKGDKMDDIVRDAVMMGVAAIQPMVTARTEAPIAAFDRGRRRERWQRIAVSSAKQCGRAVVPEIGERQTFDEVSRALDGARRLSPVLMLVEPGAAGDAVRLSDLDPEPPAQATVLIGPEGGWTQQEIEQRSTCCRLITLGGRTLRADAMPLVALAALFTRWKEF